MQIFVSNIGEKYKNCSYSNFSLFTNFFIFFWLVLCLCQNVASKLQKVVRYCVLKTTFINLKVLTL